MTERFAALQRRALRSLIPLTVHLELTRACNSRCVHCFQTDHIADRELEGSDWLSVLQQVRQTGALIISISGGEPLLSPHFWTVAEGSRALGIALRIFTNGTLLSHSNVARIAQLKPLAVEVSIFSGLPRSHDGVTAVRGSFAKTLRGLIRLRRAGVPTLIKCPLLSDTASDYAGVRRLAERLDAGVVFDPCISPRSDGGSGPTLCRSDDRTIESFFADPMTRSHDNNGREPISADRATCSVARSFMVISPEGDVLPCPLLRTPAGNVHDAPLADIWANSPLFQRLRARRFGNLVPCGTCPRSGYCGRCSAIALLEDGNLDGPSSRACRIAELRERAWGLPVPVGVPPVIPGAGKAAGD